MTLCAIARRTAVAVGVVLGSALLLATLAAAAASPSVLTATDMERFAVSSYTDVTGMDTAAVPKTPVARDKALALANEYLGVTDTQVTILMARAPALPGDRAENHKRAIANAKERAAKERGYFGDAKNREAFYATRKQTEADVKFCWK